MAIRVEATRNLMCSYYGTLVTHVSAHTADTGTTGANEMTGTGYARGAITWGTPSGSVITGTATVTLPAAASTADYIGAWNQATGGVFRDGFDVTNVSSAGGNSIVVSLSYTQS